MYVKLEEVSQQEATHELVDNQIKEVARHWVDACPSDVIWSVTGDGGVHQQSMPSVNYYPQGRAFSTREDARRFSKRERALATIRHHAEQTQECKGEWVLEKAQGYVFLKCTSLESRLSEYLRESLCDVWYDSLEQAEKAMEEPVVRAAYIQYAEIE